MDNFNRIARTNVYIIFGKLLDKLIKTNDDGDVILCKAGLSELVEEYSFKLAPYAYNGSYRNTNSFYNPQAVCLRIGKQLESNQKAMISFFNAILSETHYIEHDMLNELVSYLEELGLEIISSGGFSNQRYSIIALSRGSAERERDMDCLSKELATKFPLLLLPYNEAIQSYGHGNFLSCIENCRTLLEQFFKAIAPEGGNYIDGMLSATKEVIYDDNGKKLKSREAIFKYWIDKKKGANRFRMLATLYSALSGLGTHGEELPSQEDALLLLRNTEDILLWCMRTEKMEVRCAMVYNCRVYHSNINPE